MHKKRFIALATLLAVPIAAQVNHALPFYQALAVAKMAAHDQGYDLHKNNFQLEEVLLPDGGKQDQKYTNIGLYRNHRLLREYAVRIDTGDVVDPINCEILRYPNLLRFKRARVQELGRREASLNLISAEVGCDSLHSIGGPGPASQVVNTANLRRELAVQHFTGEFKGDVSFKPLGKFACGNKLLDVIYYSWTEATPGLDPHASYRVIFMNGKTYLGSYSVEYPPEIHGDLLQFPHSDYGDTIRCGKRGSLPKNAWLDGELNPLFK